MQPGDEPALVDGILWQLIPQPSHAQKMQGSEALLRGRRISAAANALAVVGDADRPVERDGEAIDVDARHVRRAVR